MIRIFLSYAREDYTDVRKLYDRLKAAGYQPWMDKVDLLKGDDFEIAIPQVIRATDFFIVCLSSHSVEKNGYLQKEIKLALEEWDKKPEGKLYLFPVRLEQCKVPERISKFNWTDLFGAEAEDEWESLLRSLQEGMKRLGEASTETTAQPQKNENSKPILSAPSTFAESPKTESLPASPEKKAGGRKVTELKRKVLTARLVSLEQQYFAVNTQLVTTLEPTDKAQLRRQMETLEQEIEATEDELAALPPLVMTASEVTEAKQPAAPRFQSFTEDLGNDVKLEMIAIPSGTFLMGSPKSEEGRRDNESPQHRVTVSEFYLGKCQVTQAQWQAVMGNKPSYFNGDQLPVELVSWNEAQEFCQKLSQRTGKTYRLPTEAEWEYACRAGTTGAYAGTLDEMAWYGENSEGKTHPVGQKKPNAFGLYDLHGNVWEWCQDWYGAYSSDDQTDPTGPQKGDYRVCRGGSWYFNDAYCRSAQRSWYAPGDRFTYFGLRVVQSARTP